MVALFDSVELLLHIYSYYNLSVFCLSEVES